MTRVFPLHGRTVPDAMIEEPPGPPPPLQSPAGGSAAGSGPEQICGGLEVQKLGALGNGLRAASGPAPQAQPGREAA